MKPLDNDEGAAGVAATGADDGSNVRVAPSGFAASDDAVDTPRGQSQIIAALQNRRDNASASTRVSRVVPLGTAAEETAAEESVNDAAEAPDSTSMRPSDVVPRSPSPHENRAAVRVADLAMTRPGPAFGFDENDDDDEATTVDATAGLAFEEREALVQRIHSAMEETLPVGTPPPAPAHPADDAEAARERRNAFKQTMLLGVPNRETPAPVAGPEPALLASVVRVVGPPTQPPPRRSRRISAVPSAPADDADAADHPDHEAFSLTNPLGTSERSRRVIPAAAPGPPAPGPSAPVSSVPAPSAAAPSVPSASFPAPSFPPPSSALASVPSLSVSVSRASLPGVMLPPAPEPRDDELDASTGSRSSSAPRLRATIPPLRATIDSPSSLARTRPPLTRRAAELEPLDELPVSDPFAGFVAPPPSLVQRWLVVIVVALAVVGLCSLAAIALGFLGKTGW